MKAPRQLHLFDELDDEPVEPKDTSVSAAAPAELKSYGRSEISELSARLAPLLGKEVLGQLILTDNRSRILSSKRTCGGEIDVRIHRCFVNAGDEVLEAAAAFVSGRAQGALRKRLLTILRRHFAEHAPSSPVQHRRIILRPLGDHYDLEQLRDTLSLRFFDGRLSDIAITWGRAPRRRKRPRGRFSIRLGSYNENDRVVRIHPALDLPFVPRYVVESVVYHELLHALIPTETCNGRRRLHTPEFRRLERQYPKYERAEAWLEANLERLVLGY